MGQIAVFARWFGDPLWHRPCALVMHLPRVACGGREDLPRGERAVMLRALICYLTGEHDYRVTCEPGAVVLECRNCSRRCSGWELRCEQERRRAAERRGKPAPVVVYTGRRRP
jgi:hypothetical protein